MMSYLRHLSGALALGLSLLTSSAALADARNVVLVHGMNMTGTLWRDVYDRLVAEDYTVSIAQMPLTSFEADIAAVERVLDLQDGPVVLVGHSYGGFILNEAGMDPDVRALVYVTGFLPQIGESQADLTASVPSHLSMDSLRFFDDGHYLIEPSAWVQNVANGMDRADAWFTARSQVASNSAIFGHKAAAAAWADKPTWAAIATQDRTLSPDLQRQMAARAGAAMVEIEGGHMIPLTDPGAIASLIIEAAQSID